METDAPLPVLHALPDDLFNIIPEHMMKTMPQRQPLSANDILEIVAYSMYTQYGTKAVEMIIQLTPLDCYANAQESDSSVQGDDIEVDTSQDEATPPTMTTAASGSRSSRWRPVRSGG